MNKEKMEENISDVFLKIILKSGEIFHSGPLDQDPEELADGLRNALEDGTRMIQLPSPNGGWYVVSTDNIQFLEIY